MDDDYPSCLWANPYTVCVCSCGGRYHGVLQAAEIHWVTGCANCQHPGSLHVIDTWDKERGEPSASHCRCCPDCPGWVWGARVEWSTERTWEFVPEWGEDATMHRVPA